MKTSTLIFAAVYLDDTTHMGLRDVALLVPTALTGPDEGLVECAQTMLLDCVAPLADRRQTLQELMEATGVTFDHRFNFIDGRAMLDPGRDDSLVRALQLRFGGDSPDLVEACRRYLDAAEKTPDVTTS